MASAEFGIKVYFFELPTLQITETEYKWERIVHSNFKITKFIYAIFSPNPRSEDSTEGVRLENYRGNTVNRQVYQKMIF